MKHMYVTHEDPDFPKELFGIEFESDARDKCSMCWEKAIREVTLWRSNQGTSFRVCKPHAELLAMALIRQT